MAGQSDLAPRGTPFGSETLPRRLPNGLSSSVVSKRVWAIPPETAETRAVEKEGRKGVVFDQAALAGGQEICAGSPNLDRQRYEATELPPSRGSLRWIRDKSAALDRLPGLMDLINGCLVAARHLQELQTRTLAMDESAKMEEGWNPIPDRSVAQRSKRASQVTWK